MECRKYCFTINNYGEAEIEQVDSLVPNVCNYVVYGFETAPTTGTIHMQGYLEFLTKKRIKAASKILPTAHLTPAKGTAKQNFNYTGKGGDQYEFGTPMAQGTRNDLDEIRTMALEQGMRAVSRVANLQQIRIAEKFMQYNEPERDFKPYVEWYWGPTGTGKSLAARTKFGRDCYWKSSPTKWWSNYDGHKNLVIDDFRDSWWPLTELMSIIYYNPVELEYKGGTRQLLAQHIIITSCKRPEDCYRGTGEAIQQLLRRIDVIQEFAHKVGGVIVDPPIDYVRARDYREEPDNVALDDI